MCPTCLVALMGTETPAEPKYGSLVLALVIAGLGIYLIARKR